MTISVDQTAIQEAVAHLKQNEIIGYPTEAVYGLGCDPFSMEAITKLLQLKHRSIYKGFILVASRWEQIESLVEPIGPHAMTRVLASWPGPTTWAFPHTAEAPDWIYGSHKTIAIRISDHPIVTALCDAFDGPIVSTSANIENSPPARDYRTMQMTFGDKIAYIVPGQTAGAANPTEIRDAVTDEILRG